MPNLYICINSRNFHENTVLSTYEKVADLKQFTYSIFFSFCRGPELYAFVAGEIARHCKRPASPLDVNMDVQNLCSKRQRFM